MIPSLGLLLMSLLIFFFPVDDIGARMEVLVALLLALIATKLTVTDKLPKVPYRTFIDQYMDLCFYHAISMGIEFTIVFCMTDDSIQSYYVNACFGIMTLILLMIHHVYLSANLSKYWGKVDAWKKTAQEMGKGDITKPATQFNSAPSTPIGKRNVVKKLWANDSFNQSDADMFNIQQYGFEESKSESERSLNTESEDKNKAAPNQGSRVSFTKHYARKLSATSKRIIPGHLPGKSLVSAVSVDEGHRSLEFGTPGMRPSSIRIN